MRLVLSVDFTNDHTFHYVPVAEDGRVMVKQTMQVPAGMYPCSNPVFLGFWSDHLSPSEVQKWAIENKDLVRFLNPEGVDELCRHRFEVTIDAHRSEIIRKMKKYFKPGVNLGVKYLEIDGVKLYSDDLRMLADLMSDRLILENELNLEEIENLDIEFM